MHVKFLNDDVCTAVATRNCQPRRRSRPQQSIKALFELILIVICTPLKYILASFCCACHTSQVSNHRSGTLLHAAGGITSTLNPFLRHTFCWTIAQMLRL